MTILILRAAVVLSALIFSLAHEFSTQSMGIAAVSAAVALVALEVARKIIEAARRS